MLLYLSLFIGFLVASRATPFFARLKALEQVIVNARNRRAVFQPKQGHDVPYLDVGRVEAMSRDLEAIGFQPVGDFMSFSQPLTPANVSTIPAPISSPFDTGELKPNLIPRSATFYHFFSSSASGCLASINVTVWFNAQKNDYQSRESLYFVSFSDSTQSGKEWRYETSDLKRSESESIIESFSRRNRVLISYLPGLSAAQLWDAHQRRREQCCHAGGFSWKYASSRDMEDAATADLEAIANAWETMIPLKMTWLRWRFKRERNPNEWLGELRGKVPPVSL